jgi:hypothetical protein
LLTRSLGKLAELGLIDKAVRIGISTAETFVGFFAGEGGKLVFADFAVRIGIRPFDKLGQAGGTISSGRRAFGLSALLGGGEAGAQADEAEADDE